MCPLPRLLSVATRRMASPLPHLTPTSEPQNTQERWCAGWGSCRRQRPPKDHAVPSAQRCPWPPQPGPWGCFLLRVLALQPHSQHVFLEPLLCATHSPCRRHCGRKAQTCPPTRPLPTLFPESSEKKKGSYVSMQVHRSPVGSVHLCLHVCPSVCKRTRAHPCRQEPCQAPTLSTWQVRGRPPSLGPAALPPLCPPSTPPTVRSSWGLKKEASYPRGSTCKEKQESRHGRKVRHSWVS